LFDRPKPTVGCSANGRRNIKVKVYHYMPGQAVSVPGV